MEKVKEVGRIYLSERARIEKKIIDIEVWLLANVSRTDNEQEFIEQARERNRLQVLLKTEIERSRNKLRARVYADEMKFSAN